ncbi:hypothetical protein LshimejAT787_1004120 [Lyophyllum shimeji]|uniref:Uncharacterized protein n=1 Tax=Lyophyllum shimeji TaxID=47721 RepID=A0A9P3PS80_LYOSH|nr:hypothetical protein LshimejAT787_1004120 [Lyophyllum shimeji]
MIPAADGGPSAQALGDVVIFTSIGAIPETKGKAITKGRGALPTWTNHFAQQLPASPQPSVRPHQCPLFLPQLSVDERFQSVGLDVMDGISAQLSRCNLIWDTRSASVLVHKS